MGVTGYCLLAPLNIELTKGEDVSRIITNLETEFCSQILFGDCLEFDVKIFLTVNKLLEKIVVCLWR